MDKNKKTFLKISAQYYLHNVPDSFRGLVGEHINFNTDGDQQASDLILDLIIEVANYYDKGNITTKDDFIRQLQVVVNELNQVIANHLNEERITEERITGLRI